VLAAAARLHPASIDIHFFDVIDLPTHHQPSAKPKKESPLIRTEVERVAAERRATPLAAG
jgi:hypothetical protein